MFPLLKDAEFDACFIVRNGYPPGLLLGADDSAGSTSRRRIGSVRRPRPTRRCSFGVHLHPDNAATG
jgi:hypothetical protein